MEADADKAQQSLSALQTLQSSMGANRDNVRQLHEDLTALKAQYQKASDEVSEILSGMEACPTCGAPPSENHSHEVSL